MTLNIPQEFECKDCGEKGCGSQATIKITSENGKKVYYLLCPKCKSKNLTIKN